MTNLKSTADAVTRKEIQLPGTSMPDSKQMDDDCVSEDSFGSDFDNATGEEIFKARLDGTDTELDLPPPVYSEEGHPRSMDVKPPPIVLQYTPPTGSTEIEPAPSVTPNLSRPLMCVVCKTSPAYNYPICGAHKCASKMRTVPTIVPNLPYMYNYQILPPQTSITPSLASSYSVEQGSPNRSRSSAGQMKMCDVCHVRPRAQNAAGNIYPTCGLTCAAALKNTGSNSERNAPALNLLTNSYQNLSLSNYSYGTQQPYEQHDFHGHSQSLRGSTGTQTAAKCVVCGEICLDARFVTCGVKCLETLCTKGSSNPKMCDYCHRRPKFLSYNQCGRTCRDNANMACLLCRSRPRFGRYHFCGRTCKTIASKWTPLILEVRPGHVTYDKVEQMFKHAWKGSGVPSIKKIYKIWENQTFLFPFDRYKKRVVGKEVIRYHGTSRKCTLGSSGNRRICRSTACALCSILRTSFKISQSGPFGAGIYTSSEANEAYKNSNGGKGAIILTKVVLGTVYNAKARHDVKSCPPGYNSVNFNRQNGKTTVVYTNNAIRPVYLIIF